MKDEEYKIILFDGVCNLCNDAINFVIKRDKKRIFKFASLQSEIGQKLTSERGINTDDFDSIILIDPGTAWYEKSTAALQIAKQLSGIFPLLSVFLIFPKSFRDLVYDFVARNRYKWFGKKDQCMIPTPELRALFIDQPQ